MDQPLKKKKNMIKKSNSTEENCKKKQNGAIISGFFDFTGLMVTLEIQSAQFEVSTYFMLSMKKRPVCNIFEKNKLEQLFQAFFFCVNTV